MDNLKGCPFCGCENWAMWVNSSGWHIECNGCLASGPIKDSEYEAEQAWNRRVATPRKEIDFDYEAEN